MGTRRALGGEVKRGSFFGKSWIGKGAGPLKRRITREQGRKKGWRTNPEEDALKRNGRGLAKPQGEGELLE